MRQQYVKALNTFSLTIEFSFISFINKALKFLEKCCHQSIESNGTGLSGAVAPAPAQACPERT